MNSPRIEFHSVRSYGQFHNVRSNREVIRFRVMERSRFTLLDGDWFNTSWELAPAASDAIFARCQGRASEWGGGKSCLIIHAHPESAEELTRCLIDVLSDPRSWLMWDRESRRFAPLYALEVAA
jgi:hypothetical protein